MCQLVEIGYGSLLGVMALFDWKTHRIPLWLLGLLAAVMAVDWWTNPQLSILLRGLGLLCGCFFLLVSRCTREALGYGDSLVLVLTGGCLGVWRQLSMVLLAFTTIAILSGIQLARRRWTKQDQVPFLPFLFVAYMGVWLYEMVG